MYSEFKASVLIEKSILGKYIKLPCIDNVGSCDYDDMCQLLNQISQCPDPLVAAGIPCQCPFKSVSQSICSIFLSWRKNNKLLITIFCYQKMCWTPIFSDRQSIIICFTHMHHYFISMELFSQVLYSLRFSTDNIIICRVSEHY